MDRNGEKKKIRQHLSTWSFPVVVLVVVFLVLIFLAGWFLYLESNRNYGQLATSLITAAGVVLTLSMTQARAIEQQEREDKRHHARLESEAKMQDERLRIESEREHKRLIAEAQKDRVQRSITQRIDLAEKMVIAIDHLSSENELRQAAAVQEILFQIDDWYVLIESEISGIEVGEEGAKARRDALEQESLRHRQELFDIAYKFDTKSMNVLKSRARGLKQRLRKEAPHSLALLDFSGMVIGCPESLTADNVSLDLRGIFADGFVMSNAEMSRVDLRGSHLKSVNLIGANLQSADLTDVNLESVNLIAANLESASLGNANLQSADMRSANLGSAFLGNANLQSANLSFANLESSNLSLANLQSAYFICANLESAFLDGANLESSNLNYANLYGANLSCANLCGVDLRLRLLRNDSFKFGRRDGDCTIWEKSKKEMLLYGAIYNDKTKFPNDFNPKDYGMILADEANKEV